MEPQNVISISHFLKKKRKYMHFRKRFIGNGTIAFPVNPGNCIISQNCQSPKCYKFIRQEQLTGSIIPSLMRGEKFSCDKCKRQISKETLIADISLQSLMERNFTTEQLQQLQSILITSNLEVIPQLKQRWEYIHTQKNSIRLQMLQKFQTELASNSKMVIKVNTQEIYKLLKFKSKQIQIQLNQIEAKNENKINQFCLLERNLEPRVIHCYEGKIVVYKMKDLRNIHFNQAKCCSLAFQKATKNLFYLNHNKQIYYSNIYKHTDKQTKIITFFKVGKFVSQHYNKIIIDTKLHLYNSILYIVGGQHFSKNIRDILYCDMTNYIMDSPGNHQIKFSVYTQMKEPKRYVGSDIFRYQDKHYLLIYGGFIQQWKQYGNKKQEKSSSSIQFVQLKPKESTDKKLQPIYQIKSMLPAITTPTVICFDSNFVIFGGFSQGATNDMLHIVQMDLKKKVCEQKKQKIIGMKQLKFGQYGCGGSNENEIIILSKLQSGQKLSKFKLKRPQYNQTYETIPLA